MAQYIPFVLEEEQSLIKKELSAATVCTVIFDRQHQTGRGTYYHYQVHRFRVGNSTTTSPLSHPGKELECITACS